MTNPVQIPDAAVQAAINSIQDHEFSDVPSHENMRKAITAVMPHLKLGYEVKKLEWEYICEHGLEYRAKTSIGTYSIYNDEDSAGGRMFCQLHLTCDASCTSYAIEVYSGYDSDDTIKAAAQADFERRVRECHVPRPGIKTIIDEIRAGTRQGFLNEGDQPELSDAELSCPYCSGSGHIDDVVTKPVDVAAVRRQAFEEGFENGVEQSLNALDAYDDITRNEAEQGIRKLKPDYRALSAEPVQGCGSE